MPNDLTALYVMEWGGLVGCATPECAIKAQVFLVLLLLFKGSAETHGSFGAD